MLGQVFYYVASAGLHLFKIVETGKSGLQSIYTHICNSNKLDELNEVPDKKLFCALIDTMTSKERMHRPSATKVLANAYFWDEDRVLAFVHAISSLSEELHEKKEVVENVYKKEQYLVASPAFGAGGNWFTNFPPHIMKDLRIKNKRKDKGIPETNEQQHDRLIRSGLSLKQLIVTIRNTVISELNSMF